MKKRLFALLLALAMTAALAACGGKEPPAEEEETDIETAEPEQDASLAEPEISADTETVEPDGAESEETPETGSGTADPSKEPETGSGTVNPAQQPEAKPVQKPEELPAAEPETQEPAQPSKTVDLSAFYETLAAGEGWPAMMQAEGEVLDAFYPGLSGIGTNQCAVYTAMVSATVGEIALVEVKSADDVQGVKDIFQARIDYQVGDDANPGGAWYPQTIEGWKSGSRIVSNGNFVMLVALYEGADGVVDSFNTLFG